jgi:hypothetical protein
MIAAPHASGLLLVVRTLLPARGMCGSQGLMTRGGSMFAADEFATADSSARAPRVPHHIVGQRTNHTSHTDLHALPVALERSCVGQQDNTARQQQSHTGDRKLCGARDWVGSLSGLSTVHRDSEDQSRLGPVVCSTAAARQAKGGSCAKAQQRGRARCLFAGPGGYCRPRPHLGFGVNFRVSLHHAAA